MKPQPLSVLTCLCSSKEWFGENICNGDDPRNCTFPPCPYPRYSVEYVNWYLYHGWTPGEDWHGANLRDLYALATDGSLSPHEVTAVIEALVEWPYNYRGLDWVKWWGKLALEILFFLPPVFGDDVLNAKRITLLVTLLQAGADPRTSFSIECFLKTPEKDNTVDAVDSAFDIAFRDFPDDEAYLAYKHSRSMQSPDEIEFSDTMKALTWAVLQIPEMSSDTKLSPTTLKAVMSNECAFWYLFDTVMDRKAHVECFLQTCLQVGTMVSGDHVSGILKVVQRHHNQRLHAMRLGLGSTLSNGMFNTVVLFLGYDAT